MQISRLPDEDARALLLDADRAWAAAHGRELPMAEAAADLRRSSTVRPSGPWRAPAELVD